MNNVIRNESAQTMAKQLKTDTITSIYEKYPRTYHMLYRIGTFLLTL